MRLFLIASLSIVFGISTASAQAAGHNLAYYLNSDYKVVGFMHSENSYDIYVLQNGHSLVRCVRGVLQGEQCEVLN